VIFLVDANVLIYLASGRYPYLNTRIGAQAAGTVRVSSIVLAEVALGSENGLAPSPEVLDALLALMPVIPFDEAAARAYAQLPFRRARFDRLLGAHALSLDAVVVTTNTADFADIPGLRVEDWTRPL
jgi:tRNA(fMet)-specific endonuclease VapC